MAIFIAEILELSFSGLHPRPLIVEVPISALGDFAATDAGTTFFSVCRDAVPTRILLAPTLIVRRGNYQTAKLFGQFRCNSRRWPVSEFAVDGGEGRSLEVLDKRPESGIIGIRP